MRGLEFALNALIVAASVGATSSLAVAGSVADDAPARNVCSTQVGRFDFGPAVPGQRLATFSAMITVSCPAHKEFRLRLHSLNRCRLVLGDEQIPYALFADASHSKSLLSCGADDAEYDGRGSETFMVYGETGAIRNSMRVGKFVDSLTLEILPDHGQ